MQHTQPVSSTENTQLKFRSCRNKDHWVDMILYECCPMCKRSIQPYVNEECEACNGTGECDEMWSDIDPDSKQTISEQTGRKHPCPSCHPEYYKN